MTMADATADFFAGLGRRGHDPLLEKSTGTVRFDLTNGQRTDRWLVSIKKGSIAVSEKNAPADCVIRTSKEIFDGFASGEANLMAAFLRGAMDVEGDLSLAALIQRLFPGPSSPKGERLAAGYARRQS
jgi:putative sterol carrier protein